MDVTFSSILAKKFLTCSPIHTSPFALMTPCYSWSHLLSISYYNLPFPCPLILCSFFFTMQSADSPTNPISHLSYYSINPFPVHLQVPLPTSEFPSRDSVGLFLYSFHPRCHIDSQCIFYYEFQPLSEQESDLLHSLLFQHVSCLCTVAKTHR